MLRGRHERVGEYVSAVLAPMGRRLGVDYDEAYLTAPRTDSERVFGALRCGQQLLMNFTRAEGWPDDSGGGLGVSQRSRRKAAKQFARALRTEDGHDAIAWLAQSYGEAMAQTWRDAAGPEADPEPDLPGASEALSELVRTAWPVNDYHGVLPKIERAEERRLFNPDNPEAMVDLGAYALRAGIMARAVALTMGASYEQFAFEITAPLYSLHMTYSVGMLADWARVAPYWANVLHTDALPYYDLANQINGAHTDYEPL
jgi:hypothetical protein